MNYYIFPSTQHITGTKLALFDVDGTLVVSKSGRRWAVDANDWIFVGDVPAVLQRYNRDGYVVALVSNQSEWKISESPRAKFQAILDALQLVNGWTPWCLVATAKIKERDPVYRKPGRGLYDLLLTNLSFTPIVVEMCGDAIGADDPFPPFRWSDSDRVFADGIGATFTRPTDVFGTRVPAPITTQELILLVGNPGSNKSSTARRFATAGYEHLEQDVIGTKIAVAKAARAALAVKKSVVVDATHGSAVNREPLINLAKSAGVSYRILWHIRDGRPFNALREQPVPEVAYAVYSKHFIPPTENMEFVY
jgi:bifunctional polynucleotide phosphatase/kinase